jgi:hypothetical protein
VDIVCVPLLFSAIVKKWLGKVMMIDEKQRKGKKNEREGSFYSF